MSTKPKESKDYEPIITKLSDKRQESFLTFGIPALDELTGGIPIGRMTELWGSEGVGKTHTLGQIMAANKDKKILIVDAEFSLNEQRVSGFGADTKNIDFVQDARLERVCELILSSIGKYDIILLDSLAFLTPTTVDNAEVGENSIALFARLIKHWVIKLRPRLGVSNTALVIANQFRAPLGLYVKPEPPGGKAYHHAVDLRFYMTTNANDKILKDGVRIGHWVHAEVKKSKISQPYISTKFKILY